MDDNDILRLLRDAAEGFSRADGIKRARELRFQKPGIDRKAWSSMAANGWLGLLLTEEDGGQGLGFAEMCVLAEELARAVNPEPLTSIAVLTALAVAGSPPSPLRTMLLDGIISGRSIVATAFQNAKGSLDIEATGLVLSEKGTLAGELRHVFPALGADGFVVAAKAEDDIALVYLPADTVGMSIAEELRADGSHSGRVTCRDVSVKDDAILATGKQALAALGSAIDAATLVTSAELFGLMQRALEITLDYMKTRVQFGKPIGSFQALQHRAVDLYMQQELSRGALAEAVKVFDGGGDAEARRFSAGRVKSRCGDAALLIGRESIKLHGAIGYTDEYDVGLYLRRAMTLAPWLGNPAERRRSLAAHIEAEAELNAADVEADDGEYGVDPVFTQPDSADIDWNDFSDADFRKGVRAYLEKNYPQRLRHLGRRTNPAEMKDWLDTICRKGWVAPAWPRTHGGMGLSAAKQLIFIEERERIGIARTAEQGVNMLGPMLMHYGSKAQQDFYLPKIISGEHYWCQGYSEPNAGSDLASLRTEAVPDGDDYVINGSKIWTSGGHHADHMFLLARTDKTVKKQAGISFFLLKLDTPGVSIRPIRNLAGHEEFAQVFFDNVRVPKDNLVGELNKGWTVAKTLLGFERLGTGSPRRVQVPLRQLAVVAKATGAWGAPEFRAKYVPLYLDVLDLGASHGRFSQIVSTGDQPGPEISMLKIWAGETTQRLSELLIETAGSAGAIRQTQDFDGTGVNLLTPYYTVFGATIASGSNDIQRNIIAINVLGLPR
ncbi:acyl-CoA dehydrogenase [Corticibacterium sp. UT-5YL-CI-8]|nr:acyl-CoA dehydrogenase [Tianweitania sp. UT-5YL-CI-8]